MKKVLLLLILVLLAACSSQSYVELGGKKILVEVADDMEELQTGLMHRESLCEDCGMLFVFENEEKHGFWMKNTLIPLDMVFINSGNEVVDVLHAEPCVTKSCPSYVPQGYALYVLEVNINTFDESLIGTKVLIQK